MPRATIARTVDFPTTQVVNLLLDFERYPAFVPGVLRVRVKPVIKASQKEEIEVEALLKNTKFSGTIRVLVQADRSAGRIVVKHSFGPFKTLLIIFNIASASPRTTEVRCDLELASTLAAISALVTNFLVTAVDAYADVFVRELNRLAETNFSPT